MMSVQAQQRPVAGQAVPPLSVRLVLKDRGWILEKMAERLVENLPQWNVHAEISDYPSPNVDLNHWMIYYDVDGGMPSKNSIAITHVDRPAKLHVLKQRLSKAQMGICMSRMTMRQLIGAGVPREKLCYILPAHDQDIKPNRIVVGITTQIRADGAKRESVLLKAARSMSLDAFHFCIIGPNWDQIIPVLEASGATVDYSCGAADNATHRKLILERIATFDYYLYMGWDEGSMGLLDALAAGVPTIVTPQGFHLDIKGGISYPITDDRDLCAVFERLSRERQLRIDSVSSLTWEKYAHDHASVWRGLHAEKFTDYSELLHGDEDESSLPEVSTFPFAAADMRTYLRGGFRAAASDLDLLMRLHWGFSLQRNGLFRVARSLTSSSRK